MKGLFGLRRQNVDPQPGEESTESVLFSTAFSRQGVSASLLVPWEARAAEVGATRLNADRGNLPYPGVLPFLARKIHG